jgi:hypothetical protein
MMCKFANGKFDILTVDKIAKHRTTYDRRSWSGTLSTMSTRRAENGLCLRGRPTSRPRPSFPGGTGTSCWARRRSTSVRPKTSFRSISPTRCGSRNHLFPFPFRVEWPVCTTKIFLLKLIHNFYCGKSILKSRATSVIFYKLHKVKIGPTEENVPNLVIRPGGVA